MPVKREDITKMVLEFKFERSKFDDKMWGVSTVFRSSEMLSPLVVSACYQVYMSEQPLVDVASIGFQVIIPVFIQGSSDMQAVVSGLSKMV